MKKIFSAFTFLLLSFFVFSQEPIKREYTHDELMSLSIDELLNLDVNVQVVSPKGEKMMQSTSIIAIINKQTIIDYNFQSIREAVQTVSGFQIFNTYIKKNLPTSRGALQDAYANKVLFLINGIPTFNAVTGEAYLDRIDIHDVERIEVLKGPSSVLYGSNAYAGAINVVLKTKKFPGVESHAGFGYSHFFNAGAHSKAAKGDFKLFVSGNSSSNKISSTKFTDENNETGIVKDIQNTQNFTLFANYKSNSFLINGYLGDEGFLGTIPTYKNGAGLSQDLKGFMTTYRLEKEFTPKLNVKTDLTLDWNYRNLPRDRADSIRSEIFGLRYNADIKANYNINNHIDFDFGANLEERISRYYTNYIRHTEEVITDNNLKDKSVFEHSYFIQANISYKKISATFGGRLTHNEFFGVNISPRITAIYNINKNNALKAIYGESFRAPSLFELYFINPDHTIFGNTILKPELLKSFEIAYLASYKYFFFQVIGYLGEHQNRIERFKYQTPSDNDFFIYNNGRTYQSYGTETELRYNNPKYFQVFANYNYSNGTNEVEAGSDKKSIYYFVPRHQLSLGVQKSFKNNVFISSLYSLRGETSGAISDIPISNIVDLNIGYKQLTKRIGLIHTLSFRNLLNTKIEQPEYVRQNINSIPVMDGISVFYTVKMDIF